MSCLQFFLFADFIRCLHVLSCGSEDDSDSFEGDSPRWSRLEVMTVQAVGT